MDGVGKEAARICANRLVGKVVVKKRGFVKSKTHIYSVTRWLGLHMVVVTVKRRGYII